MVDSGKFNKNQRSAWESFGIAFGTILVNEMDGMEWVTVIDGAKEFPALRFADSSLMVYPMSLIWNKVRNGEKVNLKEEFESIKRKSKRFYNPRKE